jgi:hypothetical protein
VSGTLQDVTESKRAEAALRDKRGSAARFLDHAPFAMYLKDTDLRYQLVNAPSSSSGHDGSGDLRQDAGADYPPSLADRFTAEDHEVLERGVP